MAKGRPSKIAGKKLFTTDAINPRRAGTHGFNTWKLIHENPGITTEELIAAGGRVKDVNWDIERGNVRVEDADGSVVIDKSEEVPEEPEEPEVAETAETA